MWVPSRTSCTSRGGPGRRAAADQAELLAADRDRSRLRPSARRAAAPRPARFRSCAATRCRAAAGERSPGMRGPVVSGRCITLRFHRPGRRPGAQRGNDAARAACSSVRWLTGKRLGCGANVAGRALRRVRPRAARRRRSRSPRAGESARRRRSPRSAGSRRARGRRPTRGRRRRTGRARPARHRGAVASAVDRERRSSGYHGFARELEVEARAGRRQGRAAPRRAVASLRLVLDHAALGRENYRACRRRIERHPLPLLAKRAAGIDPRARHRFDLAVGVGWRGALEAERALVGVLLAIEVRPVVQRQPHRPPTGSRQIEQLEQPA